MWSYICGCGLRIQAITWMRLIATVVVNASPNCATLLIISCSVSKPYKEKNSPYECGFEAFEDARMKFDVRYYLVAILFILFDLEITFLFPWAVVINKIGLFGFIAMMIFLFILIIGFIYEWKKGALDWE